jgi:hypothetical protein
MRKLFVVVMLAAMAVLGAVVAPQAQAQTQYPDVKSLTPFSPSANYMSLPGYLRYTYLLSSGRWISREEAEEAVRQQGAPTGPTGMAG